MLILDKIPLGMLQTNCYLYGTDKKIFIIDPAGEAEKLKFFIEEKKYNPVAILITHEHSDHLGAAEKVKSIFNIPIYASHKIPSKYLQIDKQLKHKDAINIEDKIELEVLESPGHSDGGLIYIDYENKNAFVGDTIFASSIGRTDFGGSLKVLMNSIGKNLIKNEKIKNDLNIFPGHGPITTLSQEKRQNPFILRYFN